MSSEPNLNGTDRVIQVISKKDEPDHINLSFAGSCAHGNDQCPEITINGDTLNETVTASPHNFPVVPSEPTREEIGRASCREREDIAAVGSAVHHEKDSPRECQRRQR